jgi:hypothetical protein
MSRVVAGSASARERINAGENSEASIDAMSKRGASKIWQAEVKSASLSGRTGLCAVMMSVLVNT